MVAAVSSSLDFSARNRLTMKRRARLTAPRVELALLRRLEQRYVDCDPARMIESRVEQSFNEQLFARILGYRTLFSDAAAPFHLLPKNVTAGRRYDDFSLGFFGNGPARVIGSAELKGPDANLDAPQRGSSYQGRTPVEQAIHTARELSARWALVCNFRMLRLYAAESGTLLAQADLHEIRTTDDLIALCVHFDRRALLPDENEDAEMTTALDPSHPSAVLPGEAGKLRLIARFALDEDQTFPVFRVEQALREALESPKAEAFAPTPTYGERDHVRLDVRDGWVMCDLERGTMRTRVAISRRAEVQISVIDGVSREFPLGRLKRLVALLVRVTTTLFRHAYAGARAPGRVELECREVSGARIVVPQSSGLNGLLNDQNAGTCEQADISSGDMAWVANEPNGPYVEPLANAICEIGVYFRSEIGGMAFDPNVLKENLTELVTASL